jgi:hypothetical protein
MAFTYDLATNRGKVRLKIRDTDEAVPTRQIFQDDEIDFFLTEAGGADLNLAAAGALDAISANAALLAKATKIGDYSIDSKAMAEAVMKVAAHYRALSENAPAFDYAELNLSPFSEAELIWNDMVRNQ